MDLIVATSAFLPSPGISSWGSPAGESAHAALGLAKGLRALGHRTTLVAPLDAHVLQSGLGLARRLSPLAVQVGGESGERQERTVYDVRLPSGVELVLLGGEVPSEGTTKEMVAGRLAWFGHAVAALARLRLGAVTPRATGESELEAVIAVGEHCAFMALAIREDAKIPSKDGGPSPRLLAGLSRIVIPLDPALDVRLPESSLSAIGVGRDLFTPEGIEFYNEISLAKAGAVAADKVVALGDAPRAALIEPGALHRLDGVYRSRGADVVSIGSGIDQAQYNPSTDPHLSTRFDPEDLSGKARGKASLLTELELDASVDLPFLAVLDAAPTEATIAAIARAMRGELVVAFASASPAPSAEIEQALQKLSRTHAGRVAVRFGATEPMLHRTLAAADLLLVVDPHSATGTPVRAAMRYGTVPIAARTPATQEAIVDAEASLASGSGFLFATAATGESAEADILGAVQRAVAAFATREWRKLVRRVMRVEGGWERAARRLEHLIAQLEQ
jgi:starch synthase